MAEEVENVEVSRLASELEAALAALDSALAEASRSVATIRGSISQIGYLAEMVREMEAAMALARQNLSIRLASPSQAASPMPHPAASDEIAAVPSQPEAERDEPAATITEEKPETTEAPAPPSVADAKVDRTAAPAPGPETETTDTVAAPLASETANLEPEPAALEPDTIRPISHRLRISVGSKAGSLDLKAVDGAVNENPAVVDVALLDYDGRHATLKLWISGAADPQAVQESLLASLRRRLGDEQDVEVRVDFDEAAAA